ncbi:MAG: hypothetical protein N3G18_10355 [Candidatus Saccharicenans sp.]|nr:hypothetical protein [Candidatus Saccharicenans sp.]
MKFGTKLVTLMAAVVISAAIFGLIASGLTVDKILLATRPVVESVSVFSHLVG